jgi:hypothetical protein
LGTKWALLGTKWALLGTKWALLGTKWALLGTKWALLKSPIGLLSAKDSNGSPIGLRLNSNGTDRATCYKFWRYFTTGVALDS